MASTGELIGAPSASDPVCTIHALISCVDYHVQRFLLDNDARAALGKTVWKSMMLNVYLGMLFSRMGKTPSCHILWGAFMLMFVGGASIMGISYSGCERNLLLFPSRCALMLCWFGPGELPTAIPKSWACHSSRSFTYCVLCYLQY